MAESDVEPTPAGLRRWYQLHLSTCVALMFVAGGITWMNMSTRREVLPGTADPAQVGFLEEYHDDSIGHVLWARRATRVVRLEKGLSAG